MRNIFYLLFVITAIISATSCKRDKCKDVTCSNAGGVTHGTCDPETGNCRCNSAWKGANCETSTDSCYQKVCYHNGRCVGGVCNCPAHFYGDSCWEQDQPTGFWFTRVVVNGYNPADLTGRPWDENEPNLPLNERSSGPDIYPILKKGNTVLFNGLTQGQGNALKLNADYTTQYLMGMGRDTVFVSATDMTSPDYYIELWDYDNGVDPDDFMDSLNFTPYFNHNGFPGSVHPQDTSFYHNKFDISVTINWYQW